MSSCTAWHKGVFETSIFLEMSAVAAGSNAFSRIVVDRPRSFFRISATGSPPVTSDEKSRLRPVPPSTGKRTSSTSSDSFLELLSSPALFIRSTAARRRRPKHERSAPETPNGRLDISARVHGPRAPCAGRRAPACIQPWIPEMSRVARIMPRRNGVKVSRPRRGMDDPKSVLRTHTDIRCSLANATERAAAGSSAAPPFDRSKESRFPGPQSRPKCTTQKETRIFRVNQARIAA